MTKSELIDRLAAQFPQLVAKDAELAVKMILDAMADALAAGDRIEIRGFGSFGLNYRPPRTGRNPKSGERVLVPEKHASTSATWYMSRARCRCRTSRASTSCSTNSPTRRSRHSTKSSR